MKTYDVLVVGGGMVADAAAQALREQGHDGSIGILGEEPVPPFPRPALSKKLWTDPDFTLADGEPATADEAPAEQTTRQTTEQGPEQGTAQGTEQGTEQTTQHDGDGAPALPQRTRGAQEMPGKPIETDGSGGWFTRKDS